MSGASLLQECQLTKFRSEKGEDGLLFIAKIHDGEILGLVNKLIDDGRLQGIEVLHLVNLNPRIALVFTLGVVPQTLVCKDKNIREADDIALFLVLPIK